MKAILSQAPGGPETLVLAEMADPVPGPGQIRIKVEAVGVNFPDSLIIEDRYQFRPARPFAPGGEAAGTVDAVGEGVTSFRPGDRVLGTTLWGAMAEKLVIDAPKAAVIPDEMPFDDAAAFLITYGTSHHALAHRANLRPGETLLVLGAAGGVGLAAVELGKALGARVVAAASSPEKLAFARARGADEGFVYATGPFDQDGRKALADSFKKACAPNGPDVIYDPVGGDYAEAAFRAIGWRGRFLVVGFPAGIPKLPLNLALLKGADIVGVFWAAFTEREPERHREAVADLLRLYREGRIRPQISARYPLAQAGEAIAALAARKAQGKIVVTMSA